MSKKYHWNDGFLIDTGAPAKITYLLGAGASRKCLPLIFEVPGRLLLLHNVFQRYANDTPEKDAGILKDLARETLDLKDNAERHASVDTYAKKLYLRGAAGAEKLRLLKIILSFSFIYDQLLRSTDQRYDTFFASTIEEKSTNLNHNIRIVSWNYDFQIEKAYALYSDMTTLTENQKALNVFPSVQGAPEALDRFAIFKLNGTTGFINPSTYQIDPIVNDLTKSVKTNKQQYPDGWLNDLIQSFCSCYENSFLHETLIPTLSFAWDGWQTNEKCEGKPQIFDQHHRRERHEINRRL